jgi:cardiolipin synthase
MTKLEFIGGNRLQLLHGGVDFFASLLAHIQAAQEEIFLETYLFADDETGRQVQDHLCQAAQRGVQVHVIIDWIGCGDARATALSNQLQEGGVACRIFNPWFKRGLARTHRKLCVVDRRIAYVGGINVIDDLRADMETDLRLPFPRWDFAVQIEGSLVHAVHKEVVAQWLKAGKLPILKRLLIARALRHPIIEAHTDNSLAALVIRDNLRNRSTIQKAYLKALGNARDHALLANPYFAPGRKIRRGLIAAAARGVDVRLLLGVGEFPLQDAIAQSYYPHLLAKGVKIFEYHKTKLHAKVAVVDEDWSTVGSSKFYGLSLFVNQEANIIIRDKAFTAQLSQELRLAISESKAIDQATYVKLAWHRRLKNRLLYLAYRIIMRIATLGQYR